MTSPDDRPAGHSFVIHADRENCLASGACRLASPKVFSGDDEGVVVVRDALPPSALWSSVEEAVRACPAGVLSIETAAPVVSDRPQVIEVTCPLCGAIVSGAEIDDLVDRTKEHCLQAHGYEIPRDHVVAAAQAG